MTDSKTALVTGASQGLGFSLTNELLKDGYNVIALDYKISDELKALECDKLQILQCDVSDEESVKRCRKETKAEAIDIVINNAGIWLDRKRMQLDDPNFDFSLIIKQYEVNAIGVLRIAREFMPLLLNSKLKTMINISSEAGSIGNCWRKGEYGYCMSKAAQNMATKMMHNAYSEKGVKFYSMHPGWMVTPQGLAGREENTYPPQNPDDTAAELVKLAEGKAKSGIYYNIDGTEMEW